MAGGRRTIFTLMDVNYEIENGKVRNYPLGWKKFWREVEIFPLVTLKSKWLAQIFFSILHPKRAYLESRNWIISRKNTDRKDYA
jgi:hypothetical protein